MIKIHPYKSQFECFIEVANKNTMIRQERESGRKTLSILILLIVLLSCFLNKEASLPFCMSTTNYVAGAGARHCPRKQKYNDGEVRQTLPSWNFHFKGVIT